MLLEILQVLLVLIIVITVLLLLKYGNRYFGTENRHRFFAEYFKDFPKFHNEKTGFYKKELFKPLHEIESSFPDLRKGNAIRILEIGAGPGANMEFFPKHTKLVVADPNPFFKQHIEATMRKFPEAELENYVVTGAEDMKDIPSHSIDAVVSTLVLCSAEDLQNIYKEIRRVLVPGGKFFFMEHVIDPQMSSIKILQILFGTLGICQFLFDGCRPDKDIKKELEKGGFASVDVKRFRLDLKEGVPLAFSGVYLIQPHIYGTATTAT
ncbi:unnamed protein product [Orchesella dallaii]|uniref:Methyltransferase type 11 domain-containing protein n=1 Tax=Orchesella dallaii TaxID=48710 RepID=A0ABP1QJJ6_9HEXA